jgi:hypothetical protein
MPVEQARISGRLALLGQTLHERANLRPRDTANTGTTAGSGRPRPFRQGKGGALPPPALRKCGKRACATSWAATPQVRDRKHFHFTCTDVTHVTIMTRAPTTDLCLFRHFPARSTKEFKSTQAKLGVVARMKLKFGADRHNFEVLNFESLEFSRVFG